MHTRRLTPLSRTLSVAATVAAIALLALPAWLGAQAAVGVALVAKVVIDHQWRPRAPTGAVPAHEPLANG